MISFIQNFFEVLWTSILPSLLKIFLIILTAFVIKHLLNLATNNFLRQIRRTQRAETLKQIFYSTTRVLIIIFALIMILHEIGFDVRPIIAGAGILSLAVSLGAQHVIKDVVNGFFILLEDQFSLEDIVKIGDITGAVRRMNLRTTTIEDTNGCIHIIPNSQINQVSVIRSHSSQSPRRHSQ